jgi:hypothetical protein
MLPFGTVQCAHLACMQTNADAMLYQHQPFADHNIMKIAICQNNYRSKVMKPIEDLTLVHFLT